MPAPHVPAIQIRLQTEIRRRRLPFGSRPSNSSVFREPMKGFTKFADLPA